jgi:hypothetical protein
LTSFVLRILFSGLMAFVPSEDGTEVTVLLLNVDHAYHTSDGAALPSHKPLILARAGNCTGTCPKRDGAIANFMFVDSSSSAAADALEAAVDGGGAWLLAGSDITINKGSANDPALPALSIRSGVRGTSIVPTTSTERSDFSWVANLKQLCANGCTLDPAVLGSNPPVGLIAARFRLKTGNVFTYSVARIGGNVTPVNFKRLDGTGNASAYTQAVASWVGADIEVSGSSVEIAETSFGGGAGRTMRLEPDANGKVEVAVLNLPPFIPPASPDNEAPEVGKHFEAYYELLQNPPARETRLVPRAGAAGAAYPQVGWQYVHPQSVLWSDLLNALRLNHGRSMYDRVLCPPANIPLP